MFEQATRVCTAIGSCVSDESSLIPVVDTKFAGGCAYVLIDPITLS